MGKTQKFGNLHLEVRILVKANVLEVNKRIVSVLCIWMERTFVLAILSLIFPEATTQLPFAIMSLCTMSRTQIIT
jgi:hypothetical protein